MDEKVHITWRSVRSSNVASVGWPSNGSPMVLVRFNTGKIYGYIGATRQRAVYMATRCPSVGKYVHRVLRKEFSVVRIQELEIDMTLPQKLRAWAANRENLNLDGSLLRQAADEIEKLRARVRELERKP